MLLAASLDTSILFAVLAIALVGLLIWGAWKRLVWRILSVLGVGTGAGFLVWGILLASMQQQPPFASAAAVIAMGTGVLTGSITLLVISFFGNPTTRKP